MAAAMKIFIKRTSQLLSFRRIERVILAGNGFNSLIAVYHAQFRRVVSLPRDAFENSFLVRARRQLIRQRTSCTGFCVPVTRRLTIKRDRGN